MIIKPAIDLYFWSTPNGYKVSILLEELRLPYHMIPINITTGDQFKPDFLKISPKPCFDSGLGEAGGGEVVYP